MMNQSLNETVALPAHVSPTSQRGAGTVATEWIDASRFERLTAVLQIGVIDGNTSLAMWWENATASDGTGSAAIDSTNCRTSNLGSASNGLIVPVDLRLDQKPAVTRWVRAKVSTVTSSWNGGVLVLGWPSGYGPASDYNTSSVKTAIVY